MSFSNLDPTTDIEPTDGTYNNYDIKMVLADANHCHEGASLPAQSSEFYSFYDSTQESKLRQGE